MNGCEGLTIPLTPANSHLQRICLRGMLRDICTLGAVYLLAVRAYLPASSASNSSSHQKGTPMSVETSTPTGYRNWIRINDNGGSQQIAHADQDREWKFPVKYTPYGPLPDSATIMVGSVLSILARGDETIEGIGRLVTLSWTLNQSNNFGFSANPYNKAGTVDGDPIRTVLVGPNHYLFGLDATLGGEGTWDIEISVAGNPDAVFLLLADEQHYTLEQGKSSYQKLVAREIVVSAKYLKGDVEIGYTLVQTG